MIANLLLAGWVATVAPWTALHQFSLVCSGTQTGYQDSGASQTIPWQETYTVDLVGGTYCSQGCAEPRPLSAVTADGLDLENAQGQTSSTLKRFHVLTGTIETNVVVAASPVDRFHLQQSGTCTIGPPAGS